MRVTITEQQFNLLAELDKRGSCRSLSQTVTGLTLADFQTLSVAKGIIMQAALFNVETGLGKTLIAASMINIMRRLKPDLRWIYTCQCSNISTTTAKLKGLLHNLNVVSSDATEDSLLKTFFTRRATNADVIVVSYEAICAPSAETFLFRNRHIFQGFILDESQFLSNMTSHTSRLISAIMDSCAYKYALSATPTRVAAEQMVNQVYMLDREMFEGTELSTFMKNFQVWEDGEMVGYRNLEDLQAFLSQRVITVGRGELDIRGDYTPIPILCNSKESYKELPRSEQFKEVKTDETGQALAALCHTIGKEVEKGRHGLIYANLKVIKNAAFKALTAKGFRVGILDGQHTNTQAKKDIVHRAYLDGAYDVLITNITTGKDLPSDYVVFYEQTFDYKQMIGRAERGLQGVDLDIYFILSKDTYEIEFFYRNVYLRGKLLEVLCGRDLSELTEAVRLIEQELGSSMTTHTSHF